MGEERRDVSFEPDLLIGADGQASCVRQALDENERLSRGSNMNESTTAPAETARTWMKRTFWGSDRLKVDEISSRFAMQHQPSPAGGLRFLILELPPNLVILPRTSTAVNPVGSSGGGRKKRLPVFLRNDEMVALTGLQGMLIMMPPIRDPGSPRMGTLALPPDHPFWSQRSVEAVYSEF